jgi:DNA-binding MarR family transcriptional regulator
MTTLTDHAVDEFSQACNRVYSLMHRNRSSLTAAGKNTGELSESQLAIVTPLAEHGPLPVGQVADRARVSQPTATRALKQLEAKGIVTRERADRDDRTVLVTLTPAGAEAWRLAADRMRSLQRLALEQIPAGRRSAVLAALTDLAKAIEQTS